MRRPNPTREPDHHHQRTERGSERTVRVIVGSQGQEKTYPTKEPDPSLSMDREGFRERGEGD